MDDSELQRALKLYEKQYPDRDDFVRFLISPHFRPSAATQVPTTEIENVMSVEGISRIFATLNTTGKLLTPFELVVATLYPKNIRLNDAVKESQQAFPYYKNIDESGDIFLQTIALFAGKDTKKSSLPKTITEDIYREYCDDAFLWLDEAGKLMTEQIGVGLDVSDELLVYAVYFPPLAYALRYLDPRKAKMSAGNQAKAHRKIMRWFIAAVLGRRYQQSTHDRQLRDRVEIPRWLDDSGDGSAPEWLRDTYIPNMKSAQPEGAIGKLLKCLMNARNIRDPLTDKPIGVRSGAVVTAKHHIFPTRFVPTLHGWDPKSDKNDVALNVMYLDQQTNVSWLNMDPRQQLLNAFNTQGETKVRACLKDHAISDACVDVLLRESKTRDDFYAFIESREAAFVSLLEDWGFKKPVAKAGKPDADEDPEDE